MPVGDDDEKKQCVLRFFSPCHEDLSPANPSGSKNAPVGKEVCNRRAKQFKAAIAARKATTIKSAGIPGSPGSPSPVKKPASISNYLIKGAQLTQFTDLMAKWVYTKEIPFLKMDNPFLKQALAVLGSHFPLREVFPHKGLRRGQERQHTQNSNSLWCVISRSQSRLQVQLLVIS